MARNHQGLRCWYCGEPAESRDHEPAKSKRAKSRMREFFPACLTCNSSKAELSREEFREKVKQCFSRNEQWKWKPFRIGQRIAPWGFKFYGERDNPDANYPDATIKQMKPIRWRRAKDAGGCEKRLDHASMVGPWRGAQGGLANGK